MAGAPAIDLPGREDKISTLTGNEWGDLSYYLDNQMPVWVPIWDTVGDTGSGAWTQIVGFGAIVFTDQGTQHADWLTSASMESPCLPRTEMPAATSVAPGGAFLSSM